MDNDRQDPSDVGAGLSSWNRELPDYGEERVAFMGLTTDGFF